MGFYVEIPTFNNIQLVPEGYTTGDRFHSMPYDKQWFEESIRDWQMGKTYAQKIEQLDKQYVEIDITNPMDVFMAIYDCNGLKVVDWFTPNMSIYNGGIVHESPDGTETDYGVHKWHFYFNDFSLDAGIYYVRVKTTYYIGVDPVETRYYISEPLDVKDEHPDTVLIQAYDETNKGEVIFNYEETGGYTGEEFFRPISGLRVEGALLDPNYSRDTVDFTEQDKEVRNLNTKPITTKPLYIGEGTSVKGIPPYLVEKANHLLSCDVVFVNGRRVSVTTDAEWQIDRAEGYPLYTGVIELQDFYNQDKTTDDRGIRTLLYEEPAYPYYVFSLYMYGAGFGYMPLAGNWHITSESDRDDMIAYINTTRKDALNFAGTALEDSGSVYYQNGANEAFIGLEVAEKGSPFTLIHTRYTEYEIVTSAPSQNYSFEFLDTAGGVIWGDGSQEQVYAAPNVATPTLVGHDYSTADSFTIRLFHADDTKRINCGRGDSTANILKDFTGDLPASLQFFSVENADFSAVSGGLSLTPFVNCKSTIRSINMYKCGIVAFNGSVFLDNKKKTTNNYWDLLTSLLLFGNSLSNSEATAFIVDFYENTSHWGPGTLNIAKTGGYSLSAPAPAYITALNNAGFFVIT